MIFGLIATAVENFFFFRLEAILVLVAAAQEKDLLDRFHDA
jgi:hypothetical protein